MLLQKNKQYLHCFLSVGLTVITMLLVGFALSFIQSPPDIAYITEHFVESPEAFRPEKAEQLQYMVLTVLFPCLFIAYKLLLDKFLHISEALTHKMAQFLAPCSLVVMLGLFALTQIVQPFYWESLLATRSVYTCTLLFALAFITYFLAVYGYEHFQKHQKIWDVVLLVIAIGIAFYSAWLYICYNYTANGIYQEHHVNAYFYPVYKVYSGQTILVDFKNLYGFYPYFIAPILRLLGGASELNFSIVMAGLMLIGAFCVIYTLFTACKNRVLACVGAVGVMFAAGIMGIGNDAAAGYYLQYFPQRYLFAAIIFAVCSARLRAHGPARIRIINALGFLTACLALVWNLDTGLVVFVVWSAFQIYLLAAQYSLRDKTLYKKAGMVIVSAAGQVLCAMGFVALVTYARSGVFPNMMDAFFGQSVFTSAGFFMLPMPMIHQWLLLVSLYAFALVKSIRNLAFMRKGEADMPVEVSARYFMCAVAGMGLFVYYQGRSHKDVFISLLWNGLLLLTMFMQEYLFCRAHAPQKNVKRLYTAKFLFASALVVLFAAFYLFNIVDSRMLTFAKTKSTVNGSSTHLSRQEPFAREIYQTTGVLPDLIFDPAALLYARLDVPQTAAIPERCDWFSYEECDKVIDYLCTSDKPFLIEEQDFDLLMKRAPVRLPKALAQNFVLCEKRGSLLYFIYDAQKPVEKTPLPDLVWMKASPACFISGAEDGRNWAFDNAKNSLIFTNLNNQPARTIVSADVFPSKIGDYSVTVQISNGETQTFSFENGAFHYETTLLLPPGITEITITSTAPRFDTGNGYARFGMDHIQYTILP